MNILGIETSCDDTGIAIYNKDRGLIFNKTIKQNLHSKYGGVIPELASRNHIKNIIPLIELSLKKTNLNKNDIFKIAYTAGPGLFNSLIIGSFTASALAYTWNINPIPINHLEGHLLSPFIGNKKIKFPFTGLIISGGNTQLVYAYDIHKYKIIGKTLDNSIGEVFDKIAFLLNLGYPGGKKISNLARNGINNKYYIPKPIINNDKYNLNFSFSGIKTHMTKLINKIDKIDYQTKCNISLSFENVIVDILINKCIYALEKTKTKVLVVCGGVSANSNIRHNFKKLEKKLNIKIFFPKIKFSTDNGAMIAYAGLIHTLNKKKTESKNLKVLINSQWSIEEIKF